MFAQIIAFVCAISVHGLLEPPKLLHLEDADWCADSESKCASWAQSGECGKNPAWMMSNCKKSCRSCQGSESAWKLRNDLASEYNNKTQSLRRFVTGQISVHSMLIDRVIVDEKDQSVKMHGKMVLTWNDTRVKWDEQEYELSWLTFYWPQIWTPEIRQSNTPTSSISSTSTILLAANYTGQVYMWIDFVFVTSSNFLYSKFPFDSQKVCYNLDNKRSFAVRFVVSQTAQQEADESIKHANSPDWNVEKLTVTQRRNPIQLVRQWNKDPLNIDKSTVDICLNLKRDPSYANFELVAPALIPALITLVSFLLGDFRKQIYVLIASLALQILAVYPVHHLLPPATNGTPSILKFFTFNATMTCLALVITVVLYALSQAHTFLPPPRSITKFVNVTQRFSMPCCLIYEDSATTQKSGAAAADHNNAGDHSNITMGNGNLDTTVQNQTATVIRQWEPLARSLKYCVFVMYVVLYIIVILACFVF